MRVMSEQPVRSDLAMSFKALELFLGSLEGW